MPNLSKEARIINTDAIRAINKVLKAYRLKIQYSANRRVMIQHKDGYKVVGQSFTYTTPQVGVTNDWQVLELLANPDLRRPTNYLGDGWCFDFRVEISEADLKSVANLLMLSRLSK